MLVSPNAAVRLLIFAVLTTLLAACGPGGNPTAAATVNGEPVSVDDLREQVETVRSNPEVAAQLEGDTDGELANRLQADLLSGMIEAQLLEQGADGMGVELSGDALEARRAQLIEDLGGQEVFDDIVERAGLSERQVESEIRSLLARELVAERLAEDIEIADADVEEAFEQSGAGEEQVHARHILVGTEEEATEVLERLEAGEDFGDLAGEVSEDPGSGAQGGDLGTFGRGQMVPEFEEAVFSADEGEVVGPVETDFGFHVIELLERMSPTLADVEDDVRAGLLAREQERVVEEWLADQRAQAEITVNPRFGSWDAELGQVVPPGGADGQEGGPPPAE